MADNTPKDDPTLVERWIHEQQQWQRTALSYLDSMARNDDFLVHLGNAMRGSLLAGKPYPGTAPAEGQGAVAADDRLDQVLFALHQLQGEIVDLRLTIDQMRGAAPPASSAASTGARKKKPRVASAKKRTNPAKTGTRRNRT